MANVVPGMKPSTSYESIVDKGMSREGQTVTRWQKGVIVRFGFGFVGNEVLLGYWTMRAYQWGDMRSQ